MMNELTAEVINYVKVNELDKLLNAEIVPVKKGIYDSVDPSVDAPFSPEWDDLVRLHKLVRTRRVTTVLESKPRTISVRSTNRFSTQ
jgi:U3 small nucleolar RNA-associated protein 14